jgi:protein-tyrosine phosphatase
MAEGMLRTLLADHGACADIGSAGLLRGGAPATRHAIAVMADRGIDISDHVSRTIDQDIVRSAPLIIGMTREHVRAAVGLGADLGRTFTLRELVRRGEEAGPRRGDESVPDWLARVGAGRSQADLVGNHHEDDIADPVGGPRADYRETVGELDVLLRRLVALLTGGPPLGAVHADWSAPRPVAGDVLSAIGGA